MTDHNNPPAGASSGAPEGREALLSDQPTVELLVLARAGDRSAVEALLQRCLPSLRRWAHGRLPSAARSYLDTEDIVQETALHVIRRLDHFEPRHVGAMQAHLRQSVINRVRDEVRKIVRHPGQVELPDEISSKHASQLEMVIRDEAYQRYRDGLSTLDPRDREMVVARVEMQWSYKEIVRRFDLPSDDAARMRVKRALQRLTESLQLPG
jgi:RNA polymerase sigma-70 factor (ECF subfamily)